LADTALKTADAGYLTRRLVDVSQDVIITGVDCGTLRGLTAATLRKNDEVVETLYDKILGRVSLHDVHHPTTGELLATAGEEITEFHADMIKNSPIESVEIRSVLTCEMKTGVCSKCYGRNLSTGRIVQKGETVGVIAARQLVSLVHSLHSVHSTLVVQHQTFLHHRKLKLNTMVLLK